MNAVEDDVVEMLEADSGLGLTFNENLFVGLEPDSPDDCVTVFDYPGGPPEVTLGNDSQYYRPSVQIRVRNSNYQVGKALIQAIMISLHGRGGKDEVWGGSTYTAIICTGEPAMLDWQGSNVRFVVSFNLQRKE